MDDRYGIPNNNIILLLGAALRVHAASILYLLTHYTSLEYQFAQCVLSHVSCYKFIRDVVKS